jgi:dTDP-glucose 4,6-dehydratase
MSNHDLLSSLADEEILVTGGCGFIGSEVTKQLSQLGAKVTVLDNLSSGKEAYLNDMKNVNLIKGDIVDKNLIDSIIENKTYVVNLAALPFIPDSFNFPMKFFDVNVNATITLALAAIKTKKIKRFVHISSSEIYGSARISPMDENHPTLPQSTYAVSKLAGERVVFTMHKEHNLPAVIIRPFNSFGPNITQPYIIPEIINQLIAGNDEISLGNIHSKRDLTFVSDTARAIILSLVTEGIDGETINVGSEHSIAIKNIVKMIAEIMNRNVTIKIDSSRFRPHDVETLVCDYGKASRLLDWKPEIKIQKGLEMTVKWAQENGVHLKSPFKSWPSTYRNNFKNESEIHD